MNQQEEELIQAIKQLSNLPEPDFERLKKQLDQIENNTFVPLS